MGLAPQLVACCLAASVLVTPQSAHASDPDPWFGQDKLVHFSASAALASAGYLASSFVFEERAARAAVGGGFSLSLGVTKELVDLGGAGHASWRDLTWDALGALVGVGLSLLVDTLLSSGKASGPARSPSALSEERSLPPASASMLRPWVY